MFDQQAQAFSGRAPVQVQQRHCVFTPSRARMVLSLVSFGGDCDQYMNMSEVKAVRELFEADPSGSITFGAIVRRIAACEEEEFRLPPELAIWKALTHQSRLAVMSEVGPHLNERVAHIAENLEAYAALAERADLNGGYDAAADEDHAHPVEPAESRVVYLDC